MKRIPYSKYVRAGIAFLDEKYGTAWRKEIDLDRLDMNFGYFNKQHHDGCGCILAQLEASQNSFGVGIYSSMESALGLDHSDAVALGFNTLWDSSIPMEEDERRMKYLTRVWKRLLEVDA
jgi:hypothetical protein